MSAISIRPIIATPFTASQSRKLLKKTAAFAQRLDFWSEFSCNKSVSWAHSRRNQNRMKGFNWVRATTSDEGALAFEQEASMEESLTFGASGIEATLNNLSKWLVAALFGLIIVWRHDAEALWAATGSVINTVVSIALKRILNQERPFSTSRSDPGMPSSHAQSIFYTLTFLNLSMVESFGVNVITATVGGLFFILASYLAWLRVSQQFHTVSQIVVGAVLGSVISGFWFWLWYTFVLNLFITSLWVRIIVVLGGVGFCLAFIHHVYKTWIIEER
ncbi:hypothetical protein ACP275_08G258600 [Erythranthe tilingii]